MTKPIVQGGEPKFIWTLDRYHDAIDKGVLTENDKVELIFGEIVPKMPVGEPHADVLSDISDFFYERLGTRYKFRAQSPVTLPNDSEPEPDFAIVVRRKYTRKTGHPKPEDILLLIEVSDTTPADDRTKKAKMFSLANIKEYWIINIPDRQVEVHLQPSAVKEMYRSLTVFEAGSTFESPFCGSVKVDDILPETEEA